MKQKKKQAKRPFYESDSEQEPQYSKFIVLQSKELPLTKLSPFIIEETILSIITSILVKNLKNKLR